MNNVLFFKGIGKKISFLSSILFLFLAGGLNAYAAAPTPVPAASQVGLTVGSGFVEHTTRQVVRTSNNVVYVVTADDNPCQVGGKGVIHIWKGLGAQASNSAVPTSFTEQDAANRPTAAVSGSCVFAGGVASTLLSPDIRLNSNGIIGVAYIDGSNGNVYYQTYSTITDTWGAREVAATGALTSSGTGWTRTGQLAMTLDANDVPNIIYPSSGTSNSMRYVNKIGGTWSSPTTIATGTNVMHGSLVTALDGTLHAAWLDNSLATHSIIKYAHRDASGVWSAVETVSAGDSLVLSTTNDDQGPNITTDLNSQPHVLYLDGVPNGPDNYVRLRYRNSTGVWTDNTPPGTAGGPSNPNGTWYTHSPQMYYSQTGDPWVFLGHDINISGGGYEYQIGGPGNSWSAYSQLDPRNSTNTTAGTPGLDGSASVRFDPLRDNNPGIIDVLFYDENDGTAGYDHHATLYYKAIVLNNAPDTTSPSVPTNLSASPVSTTQINLSWSASTDNVSVAGYKVFRDGLQIATTTITNFADMNLSAGTQYSYTVSAYDAAGNSSAQSTASNATTFSPDIEAPSIPANLTAQPVSAAVINLSWSAATDNVGVAGYQIFRDGNLVATTTALNYADGGLAAGTQYAYTVAAYDASLNISAQSGSVSATTLNPDLSAPSVPTGLTATNVTSSSINLSWSASTDNVGVAGYKLFRGGVQIATTTALSYSNTGLSASTAYTYNVSAFDASGNYSALSAGFATSTLASASQTYTLFGSNVPTVADVGTDSSVELGIKFTSDFAGQVTAIKFYKSAANTGTHTVALWSNSGTLLASGTASNETSSGWQTVTLSSPVAITAGTTYVVSYHAPSAHYAFDKNYFTVKYDNSPLHAPVNAGLYAYGSSRVFPSSSYMATNYWVDVAVTVGTITPDTTAPTVPTNLIATATSVSTISLTWTAATDNVGVVGYRVYRNGVQIATTTSASYNNSGLNSGTTYSYMVDAFDAAGNYSAQSNPASATTQTQADVTPPVISSVASSSIIVAQATIAWATNENSDSQVEFGPTISYGTLSSLDTNLTVSHSVLLSGLSAATTYHFRVRSKDAAGNLAASGDFTFTTASAPDATAPIVSITSPTDGAAVSGTVNVAASASDNVGVVRVEFYLDGVLKATDTSTPYAWSYDTTQSNNASHAIIAKAYDLAGNVGTSATVNVTVSNTAPTSITLVQKGSNNVLNTSQATVALASPVTAGNLIVVAISSWPSAPAATAITDSLGNVYTLAGTTRKTSGGAYTGIYYAKNVAGGSDTITFKTASGGSELSIIVAEFTGANTSAPLDKTAGATGRSSTPSSGNMTPVATGELVISAGTHDNTEVTSAGSGFTLVAVTNENASTYQPLAMAYKIQTTTSAVAATLSLSKTDNWAQAGALFKK
ncbi:MAG: DUF4082 domain-containing protein [Candidatus Doudnabacteria bacterium]|nr:DUF4082 domain-containing protein [Candidatus Doudnabacteria bacterium]